MSYKCFFCYQYLDHPGMHKACSRKIFDRDQMPALDTSQKEMEKFARFFIKERIAVTGVQKKLSLHLASRNSERFTILGALGGNYILKPPSDEFDLLPELEDLTMKLAKVAGIQVALHSLVPLSDGKLAFITKRFDREKNKKLAQEDACQLSELLTESKYKASHEKLGRVVARYSSFPGDDVLRVFELTIFSFLTGNADMHLKNFSLLKNSKGHYRLSPAYDLVPTRLLLSEKEDPEELALHLNGKKSKFDRNDFLTYADYLGITEKVVTRTLGKLEQTMPKMTQWIDNSFLDHKTKKLFKALISSRMARLQH